MKQFYILTVQILKQETDLGVNHGALRLLPRLTETQSELYQISFVTWDTILRHAAHTERLLSETRLFESSGLIYNVGLADNVHNERGHYDYRLCD